MGYVELGLALSIFNIVTALVQAPMGFAVDHYGARRLLIAGVALGSISFLLIALFATYTSLLIAMALALAGIANAVYHPANYALLSQEINPAHIGKAFSVHTFAGFLGAAIAPVFAGDCQHDRPAPGIYCRCAGRPYRAGVFVGAWFWTGTGYSRSRRCRACN